MSNEFETGVVLISEGTLKVLSGRDIKKALERHKNCDWGESGFTKENERGLRRKKDIISVYRSSRNQPFFIATPEEHTITLVLLPGEYYQFS